MIRPAKFVDIMVLVDLMEEMHAVSRFAGKVGVDRKAAQSLMQQAIQRNGGTNDGGAFVAVAEQDGKIEGFIVGALGRLYLIGDRLEASDLFLYVTPRAGKLDARRLFRAYLDWGWTNPRVYRVLASHTDAVLGDDERVGMMYQGEGFHRIGAIYERETERAMA